MTEPVEIYDEPAGRSEYVTGLIAGAIIGVAAGAIFTGIAARRQPCPCEHEALEAAADGAGPAYVDPRQPVPATAAIPRNGAPAAPVEQLVVLDDTPLPAPTAETGPASPSRAPFPGVLRPGSPVAGPWASRNGHDN